jgi:hypothetical protein
MSPKAFPSDVIESLLVKCHRYCCLCHKFCSSRIEVHHINPNGGNAEDNGIPLCFDCHAEVRAYDPSHPKGRKFTPSELKKHRDQWFSIMSKPPYTPRQEVSPKLEPSPISPEIFKSLRIDDQKPTRQLIATYISKPKEIRAFIKEVVNQLNSDIEDTRLKMGNILEELIEWDPSLVSADILEKMSENKFFSVRSSAAYCYYLLASADPGRVPIHVVAKLARYGEDYYVNRPALACLMRLAKSRYLALDVICSFVKSEDPGIREYGAHALLQISLVHPLLIKYIKEDIEKEIKRYPGEEHRSACYYLTETLNNMNNPPVSADYSPF